MNQTANVMVRDLAGTGNAYGQNNPAFSQVASGWPCRVSILGVPVDLEFRAKDKLGIAFRKVLMRPWFLDQSPDGSYVPNHVYQSLTYNTEPLTNSHWLQIATQMYDIFEMRNPGGLNHHLEISCRVILV